ncbi:CRISPR-associated helicase Cas3' [Mesonia aestuariivivens]|uniref:CRISPR-associated helicase Cas3 n=1 Tax=Mesonia aestuariivivens TaxID=2796128 RepID=A0ABS6VZT1_9FLAO|nr:CRISPR-associated helicase Cas3' [Mesonia aestuariivivens]MBW2961107.1 CRISPR-associated helicase Cas3' [Mesonia aestuariivivens]
MNKLDDIWAKSLPVETLTQHTSLVLEVWYELKERYFKEIENKDFWFASFSAVAYHDFGKLCNIFQETIRGERAFNNDERVRHEFFSGTFLLLNNLLFYEKKPESLVAVYSHHKAFNDEGFNEHISRNSTIDFVLENNLIDQFVDFVNQKSIEFGEKQLTINDKFKYAINNPYATLLQVYKQKVYNKVSEDNFLNIESRRNYIYHKALLNISDWTASGHLKLEKGIIYNIDNLAKKIIEKLVEDGKEDIANNFKFRKFQEESLVDENVIAIAPTGSGKTEAALTWSSSKKDWERIIYLLPTRVTSNAIHNRLTDYFGNEYTQLIHSSARQYIKEQFDNSYDQKKYFRDKSFFKNINICTVDQLLTLGFNLGFWEVKTFHMLNARVIIDEIHLYSPYTLGLIISTIKYLKDNFNTKFYIMTATMPQKLLSLLEKTLENVSIIKDQELLEKSRNIFQTRNILIEESLDEIEAKIEEGKKVLVVVNTVDKAIELYESLAETAKSFSKKAICYHSRYIKKDRAKKEQEIFDLDKLNNGGLLIATQVVEVSLDIDFDILYTENAPIDAIIQRAGRVNRKRQKRDTKVIIFNHYEISEKIYDVPNILENTYSEFVKVNNQRLSEKKLNELVDIVYKDLEIETNDKYIEGLHKHSEIQYKYNYIKDLTTDEKVFTREGLDTISIIPNTFEEELYTCEDRDKLSNHELTISRRRANAIKITPAPLNFKFADVNYDVEKGLTFKEKNENKSIVC